MSESKKQILGHIDCPTCGTTKAMRVKADKNGDPFGYCEDCAQQLRVGGDRHRVRRFMERHGLATAPAPVTGTGTAQAPAAAPPTAPKPAARPTGAGFFDQLLKGD